MSRVHGATPSAGPSAARVVAVIAHGEHVADVVPSGELDRLRETIEVLSDPDALRALADTEIDLTGIEAVQELVAERTRRERP